jgi:hypothetical protein
MKSTTKPLMTRPVHSEPFDTLASSEAGDMSISPLLNFSANKL